MSQPEIERVFLLDRMPQVPADLLASAEVWELDQGYFPRLPEIRAIPLRCLPKVESVGSATPTSPSGSFTP